MDTEKRYQEGFNNGYTLARYEPDLLSKIVKNLSTENDYFQGFSSGKEQFELESTRTQLEELDRIREETPDRENEIDRDR